MRQEAIRDRRTPWCPAYAEKVEMNLILKKHSSQNMNKTLPNYKKLFKSKRTAPGMHRDIPTRILVEDNSGIGETAFGRNVERDYAKKSFKKFKLMLLAPLKLMTPNDCVEHVILRDNIALQEMQMSPQKLRRIFEVHGKECLIILDGSGEHIGWQKNKTCQDISKIIKGECLSDCTILLTSRSEFVEEIESNFQVVVQFNGFSKDFAKRLAENIRLESAQVDKVLKMRVHDKGMSVRQNRPNEDEGEPLYMNCRLFIFVCMLVKCNDIELDEETDMVDITFRSIRIV